MSSLDPLISWAPRVSREKILQLYIEVASGINNEELIDFVADSFYRRCSDIVRISERRFACPVCKDEFPHPHPPEEDLKCTNCGWHTTWREHLLSYRGRQLSVNTQLTHIPKKFIEELPRCKSLQEKVILIDTLIHSCHVWLRNGTKYYSRPLAVNFIDGKMNEVIAFLENLPKGPDTLPQMNEQFINWRKHCLSLMSDLDVEKDLVKYAVDSMPGDLRIEIEEMIKQRHRQKAVSRLQEIEDYTRELTILHGTVATQMVRTIEKQLNR